MFRSANRRGVSLIVSYVLLITIALALSTMVYSWLRFYVSPSEAAECPGGVSLVIRDYECFSDGFNLSLKNKGTHTIDGFRVSVHDRADASFAIYIVNSTGVSLKPGEEFIGEYSYDDFNEGNSNKITIIEVSPFVVESGEKVYCDNSVASQKVSCSRA